MFASMQILIPCQRITHDALRAGAVPSGLQNHREAVQTGHELGVLRTGQLESDCVRSPVLCLCFCVLTSEGQR